MFKKIVFVLCSILFCFNSCFASDLTVKKLPRGQKVIIKEVKTNPIVTIDTWIKTGSIDETVETQGVAHFLEHLFFKGTHKNPTGVFDKKIESKGGITNAATSKDYTHYYITIPSDYFEEALSLHADMLLNPMIPRKELEKERLVVLEEISKNLDSPDRLLSNNLFDVLYEGHPYKNPVIGTQDVIKTVTRESILDFYHRNYDPSNMTTVIVGDVDTKKAMELVEKYFKTENDEYIVANKKYPKINELNESKRIVAKKNIETAYISIAYRVNKNVKQKEIYALDVLSSILAECASSRLNQNLKEEKQLVNSISSGFSLMRQDNLFSINAVLKPENLDVVEKEIYKEIENIKLNGITKEELDKAKSIIATGTYYDRESTANIANSVGYLSLFYDGTKFYDNYVKNINNVNLWDVKKVANKYLINNKNAVSIVLPEKFDSKNMKKMWTTIPPAQQKNKTVRLKYENLYESLPNYSILEKNSNTTKYKLENGMIVIIENNLENEIVAMNISAFGGNFIEKTPSEATLVAKTIKDKTVNYKGADLSRFLDERGIGLSYSAGVDTFNINLLATRNELEAALNVLYETANNAVFDESDISKNKKQIKASIARTKDNPLSLGVDTFKSLAFSDMVYGRNTDIILKNIDKVKRSDLINYYKKILSPKNLVVSVVGNVDDKKILSALNYIFKDNGISKNDIASIEKNIYKPVINVEKTIEKKDVNTSWLLLGFKTCDIYNKKDRAVLKVINAMLGEGMSSRLFRNLRDNQGLAYAVGSSITQNILDGVFLTYIGTSPEKIEIAKTGILNEINILKTEYVTQEELQKAKDKILGNLLISLETNADKAGLLNAYGVLDLSINYLEENKRLIEEVSQSDILAVANKYFSAPYIYVVVKP